MATSTLRPTWCVRGVWTCMLGMPRARAPWTLQTRCCPSEWLTGWQMDVDGHPTLCPPGAFLRWCARYPFRSPSLCPFAHCFPPHPASIPHSSCNATHGQVFPFLPLRVQLVALAQCAFPKNATMMAQLAHSPTRHSHAHTHTHSRAINRHHYPTITAATSP